MEGLIFTRPSRREDEPALRALWKTVFGDEDAFLDLFFRELYAPGMAAVVPVGDGIAAAAYALPMGKYRYIYAVATLPEFRGRGLGRAVTLAAADGRGAYLCPAGEALKRWYADTMGAVPAAFRAKETLPEERLPLAPEEYSRRREELLSGVPHPVYPSAYLALFALSGGFFADGNGGIWAAAEDGTVEEHLPSSAGGEPVVYALNGAPPLHWGITLS